MSSTVLRQRIVKFLGRQSRVLCYGGAWELVTGTWVVRHVTCLRYAAAKLISGKTDEYRIDSLFAYSAFISGLKASPTFAPSFTYLGLYYMDVASPPDLVRGPKCFQKALELDPREDEAAKRLAEGVQHARLWRIVR